MGDMLLWEIGACETFETPGEIREVCGFQFVKELMDKRISDICYGCGGTEKPRIYLTGKGNFREKIAEQRGYKANRLDKVKPFHYENLKGYLIAVYGAQVYDGMEADDAMCIDQIATAKEFGVAVPFHNGVFLLDYDDWVKYSGITFIQDSKGYIVNDTGKGDTRKVWYLHRALMGDPEGLVVDHINGNKLDNRRYNLRVCSTKENIRNSAAQSGSSSYKGVHWDKSKSKWTATIKVDRQSKFLGRFDSEEDAARAYDTAAKEYFGEYARLNMEPPYVKPFKQTIICSRDKDLRQCPLLHYSWECGKQAEWGPHLVEGLGELFLKVYPEGHKHQGRVKKLTGTGDLWFLAQILMGDDVDNIPGLSGYGPRKVYDLLSTCSSYEEAKKRVEDAYTKYYEKKGKLEEAKAAINEQAQLVWMVREMNEDGSLKMAEEFLSDD